MRLIIVMVCLMLVSCQTAEEIKKKQYFVEGFALYKTNCANCHQLSGEGLAGLYPPIAKSDYLSGNKLKVICLMKNGINDTLIVNGKTYSQPMPANLNLTDLELAELTTYIYNKWGDETIITNIEETNLALQKCK